MQQLSLLQPEVRRDVDAVGPGHGQHAAPACRPVRRDPGRGGDNDSRSAAEECGQLEATYISLMTLADSDYGM